MKAFQRHLSLDVLARLVKQHIFASSYHRLFPETHFQVNVNNKELNFNNHSAFSSGDVSACPKGGELFPIKIFTTEGLL